jgi:hypothetical protein
MFVFLVCFILCVLVSMFLFEQGGKGGYGGGGGRGYGGGYGVGGKGGGGYGGGGA